MNEDGDILLLADIVKELRLMNRNLVKLAKQQQKTNSLISRLISLQTDSSSNDSTEGKRALIREVYKIMAEIDPILSNAKRDADS